MSFLSFFRNAEQSQAGLDPIFKLGLCEKDFIRADILQTYMMILTDVVERTHGISETDMPALWDSCLKSESSQGLVSYLACAMTNQSDLFLVYKSGVLREATREEVEIIKNDYKTKAESATGVYISFCDYGRTDMLKIYSALEYIILSSLNKSMSVSKAIQIKVANLRESVSLGDSSVAIAQAKSIADALRVGNDVAVDSEDEIATTTPDITSTEKAIDFLDCKRGFVLSLPKSYISGEQTGGIGSTGEADMRAVERGLKQFFNSIIGPAVKAVFKADPEYQSQDFRFMTSGFDALKAFTISDQQFMSTEAKRSVIQVLFGLDSDEEEKNLAEDEKAAADEAKANADRLSAQQATQNNGTGNQSQGPGNQPSNGKPGSAQVPR